jgi:hypothetical protein
MQNPQDFIKKKISMIKKSNLPINLFFLKQTSSEKPENFFDIKRVALRDNADNHFKKLLEESLSNLNNREKNKMNDFFNDVNNVPSLLSISQIERLSGFIKIIKQFDTIIQVHNENALKKIDAHAFKIELTDGSEIVFFTKIPRGGKISFKGAFLRNGDFNLITEVPLIYEDRVDCIFFSDDKDVLILNKSEMESIFKFDDYYIQKTKYVYDHKLQNVLIRAPENLFDTIKDSPQITKKVTRMTRDKKFDISQNDLKKHMDSLEENKGRFNDQFKNYKSLEDENGLFVTNDIEDFKVFLNACDKSVEIPLEQKEENEPDIYLNPSPIKMTK